MQVHWNNKNLAANITGNWRILNSEWLSHFQIAQVLDIEDILEFLLILCLPISNLYDIVLKDDSGFRIYYTTRLRQHDLGNVQIGQNQIAIQPLSETTIKGSCSSGCTRMFPHSIYLTRTYIHMHYLGQ